MMQMTNTATVNMATLGEIVLFDNPCLMMWLGFIDNVDDDDGNNKC